MELKNTSCLCLLKNVFFSFLLVLTFSTSIPINSSHAMNSDIENGQNVFKAKGCIACHTIGKGKLSGPDLLGVTQRREEEWLKKWLKNPDTMVFSDPIAKEMLQEYMVPMPNQGLSDEEIEQLIIYFKHNDSKNKK